MRNVFAGVRLWAAVLLAMHVMCAQALAQQSMPPPPVTFAMPLAKRIVIWDEYTGRFEAVQRVEVRPRVSGFIQDIDFTDGAIVQKGDKLFTIDQRPYQIAVQAAQAEVLRTQALVLRGGTDYARAQQLVKSSNVTVRDLDQRKADFDVARAQELSAEASLRNAQLDLEWSSVVAPIGGRISNHRVDVGNLVSGTTDPTLLTTIVSQMPIYFTFEAAEADYIRYNRMARLGQRPSSRDAANPVQVQLADEAGWKHLGSMNFVDNEVDQRSGTIRARAIFDNKDLFLTPGTFGRLRLFGGYLDALLVPDAAISSDQAQKILLVVGPNNAVEPRQVTVGGMAYGLRVVTAGLGKEDKVIIDGLANPFVRPGATVQPQPGEVKLAGTPGEDDLPDTPDNAKPGVAPAPATVH